MSLNKNRGQFGLLAEDLRRAKRIIDPSTSKLELLWLSMSLTPRLFRKGHEQIFTHMTVDERLVLFLLAERLRAGATAVEVGSFLGASACYLAEGLGGKGKVYCVDTWNNDAMDEAQRDTFDEFKRNTARVSASVVALRGRSEDVARSFDGQIDLLFTDADHSYEGCLADWQSWSGFLGPDAVLVFHDWGWAEGVQKVVKDLVAPRVRRELQMPNMYVGWL